MKPRYAWARWTGPTDPLFMQAALLRWEENPLPFYGLDSGWRAVYDLSTERSHNYGVFASHLLLYTSPGWHLVELKDL